MSCFVGFSTISSISFGYATFHSKKYFAGVYVVENFA